MIPMSALHDLVRQKENEHVRILGASSGLALGASSGSNETRTLIDFKDFIFEFFLINLYNA